MFKSLLARAREARAYELEGGEESLEGGFTLIELMVVLLIIAILLAIAIPTFLGVSGSAKDRSAQSNATNALTNAIAYYQNSQTFNPDQTTANSNVDKGMGGGLVAGQSDLSNAMQGQEPALSWYDGTTNCTVTNAAKCVSVQSLDVATGDDGQGVLVAVMSTTGNCWFVANLQGTPAAVASTGFQASLTANATGDQMTGLTASPTVITTAGTWYAYLPNAGSNCKASYPIGHTNGFFWGDSYAQASNLSVTTKNT